MVVVEYTDYECFFCEKGYRIMKNVMEEFPGKVRWLYKSLPLNSIHPWAQRAAVASECAGLQGQDKLWLLHDAFFEAQSAIKRNNIDRWLRVGSLGIQPSEFAKLGLIIYMAKMLDERHQYITSFFSGVMPALVVTGAFAVVIVLEPDFGAALVLCSIIFGMWVCAASLREALLAS